GLEAREGTEPMELGAGDQGMMFGYATDETPELMPAPIVMAHRIAKRLAEARKAGELPFLRPDGKSQVTIGYDHDGRPRRVHTALVSTQHDPGVDHAELEDAVRREITGRAVPADLRDRRDSRRSARGDRRGTVRPASGRDHRGARPAPADLPANRCLRSFRAAGSRSAVGAAGPCRAVARRRGPRRGTPRSGDRGIVTRVPARDTRAWGEQAIRGPVARLAARLQAFIGREERRPVDRLPDLPVPLRRSPLAVPYLDAARERDHRRAGAAASNASEQAIEARAWWAADAWAHRDLWNFERVDKA